MKALEKTGLAVLNKSDFIKVLQKVEREQVLDVR